MELDDGTTFSPKVTIAYALTLNGGLLHSSPHTGQVHLYNTLKNAEAMRKFAHYHGVQAEVTKVIVAYEESSESDGIDIVTGKKL